MSGLLSGMAFDRYPADAGIGELLLAVKLADNAHDDGTHVFPSVAYLAQKTRQSERTVQYQLRRMELIGWLVLVAPEQRGRPGYAGAKRRGREYRISPEWIAGLPLKPPAVSTPVSDGPGEKGADSAPFSEGSNGCKSDEKRVQPEAEKGATAVAPEPSENHQENQTRDARAPAGEAGTAPGAVNPDVVAPFPADWQPDETCKAALAMQRVPMPEDWQVQAFVGHWLGKQIAPRRIPGEFLKWAARERGFAARDARQSVTASGQQAAAAADPAQRVQAEQAFERLRQLAHRGSFNRGAATRCELAALQAMGGLGAFDSVASADVPKLRARFVAGYCEFLQRGQE